MATVPSMAEVTGKCSWCGFDEFQEGWVTDLGQGARAAAWIAGPMEKGLLGGAKWMRKARYDISAARCLRCSHLELFVPPPAPPS